jgi:hypothetical protein
MSEKQTQPAGRTRGFTAQQKFDPAVSEAAKPGRCRAHAVELPHTSRWMNSNTQYATAQPTLDFLDGICSTNEDTYEQN